MRSGTSALGGRRARRAPRFAPATGQAAGARLPLATLRTCLDERSTAADWAINPDGVMGRALIMAAGATVTVPLQLGNAILFSAQAILLPHDWRDGRGAVLASVAAVTADGDERKVWSGALRTSAGRGSPRGLQVDCRLPVSSTSLRLTVHPGPSQHRAVARALWLDPTLIDPHAPPGLGSPGSPEGRQPPGTPPDRPDAPLISVLVPVHDPPPYMLEEAIAAVRNQTYPHWELCLVDDGSQDPDVIVALQRHAASDPRIRLARRDLAGGISTATNAALALATGDYVALLDHDDTLAPDALAQVADTIATRPNLDMIYTDEDIVDGGRQVWVHLKPGWSPDTLRTNGYTCHLGVYRRVLVTEIGGFRTEFNGSQDVDMILRLIERTDRIAHIPRILYHWRAHASSTAGGDAKPYAYVAARNAIASHLHRCGVEAEVGFGPPGLYRVAHRVEPSTAVDLVLALDDHRGLAEAARSWLAQPHPAFNVILATPPHTAAAATAVLTDAGLSEDHITVIPIPADDHTALTVAADAARSEHLLLMQAPAAGLTHDWLTRLIGYSHQDGIAAAGPILLSPDGRIQQAGIAIPDGIPLHLLHGTRSSMDDFFGYGTSVYNVTAVSGIAATRRDTYRQLGGLECQYGDLALIEYCLRATDAGQRVVIVPDARLRATGPDRTMNDLPTLHKLRRAWSRTHDGDPYYNPNYRTDRGDFRPIGS